MSQAIWSLAKMPPTHPIPLNKPLQGMALTECLFACLLACLPACLLACSLTCLHLSMKECSGKKVLILKVAQKWPKKLTRWTVISRTCSRRSLSINIKGRRVAGYQEWCHWSIQPKILICLWTLWRTKYQSFGLILLNVRYIWNSSLKHQFWGELKRIGMDMGILGAWQ